jgi:hypothetical protein
MLLEGLLIKDPRKRLGSLGGIREILGHPWVRRLKPADVATCAVPTPIAVDLLTFNVNQEEIDEAPDGFAEKLTAEDAVFEPAFEDFYFNRSDAPPAEAPLAKAESAKETKGCNQRVGRSKERANGNKSQLREQPSHTVAFNKSASTTAPKGCSEPRAAKAKKAHVGHLSHKVDLVVKGRKRDNKSITNNDKARNRLLSPKAANCHNQSKVLKRIKSSAALHEKGKWKQLL